MIKNFEIKIYFTSIVIPVLLARLRHLSVELQFWMILTTILHVTTLELAGRSSHSGYSLVTIPDLWFMMLQLSRLKHNSLTLHSGKCGGQEIK